MQSKIEVKVHSVSLLYFWVKFCIYISVCSGWRRLRVCFCNFRAHSLFFCLSLFLFHSLPFQVLLFLIILCWFWVWVFDVSPSTLLLDLLFCEKRRVWMTLWVRVTDTCKFVHERELIKENLWIMMRSIADRSDREKGFFFFFDFFVLYWVLFCFCFCFGVNQKKKKNPKTVFWSFPGIFSTENGMDPGF